jgi:hypothetical protein
VKGRRPDSLGDFNSIDEISQWLSDNPGIANAFKNLSPTKNSQTPSVVLAIWVSKQCSPDKAKYIAENINYNDNPIFFAKKRKTKLVSEMVILNTAIAFFVTNQIFEQQTAKTIIDGYLSIANKSIFEPLEKIDNNFNVKYEKHISDYFSSFTEENPLIGISYTFLQNLGLKPLKDMNLQVFIAKEFGEGLAEIGTHMQEKFK